MLSGFRFVLIATLLSAGSAVCSRPDGWILLGAASCYGMVKLVRFMVRVGTET